MHLGPEQGARFGLVEDIEVGPDSSLWITTDNGLWRYRNGVLDELSRAAGLPFAGLWPVVAQDSTILVGTLGRGVLSLSLAEAPNPAPQSRRKCRRVMCANVASWVSRCRCCQFIASGFHPNSAGRGQPPCKPPVA